MLIDRLERQLAGVPGVGTLVPASEYIPPHKMVEFVPYDGVVTLHDTGDRSWTQDRVQDVFDEYGVTYHTICGVGDNDTTAPGDKAVFVRFRD